MKLRPYQNQAIKDKVCKTPNRSSATVVSNIADSVLVGILVGGSKKDITDMFPGVIGEYQYLNVQDGEPDTAMSQCLSIMEDQVARLGKVKAMTCSHQ